MQYCLSCFIFSSNTFLRCKKFPCSPYTSHALQVICRASLEEKWWFVSSRFFWMFVALLETFLSLKILCFQVSYDIRSYAVWTQLKQLRVEAWLCFVLFVCFVSTKKKFTTKSNLFVNRVNNVKIERIWRKLLTLLYMFDIPWRFLIQFLRRTSQSR